MKNKIDFKKFMEIEPMIEIKNGKITEVVKMENSKKMLKLTVDFSDGDIRTVMTNIGDKLDIPNYLVGQKLPFVTNLEPAVIMGVESTAMILVPMKDGKMDWFANIGSTII